MAHRNPRGRGRCSKAITAEEGAELASRHSTNGPVCEGADLISPNRASRGKGCRTGHSKATSATSVKKATRLASAAGLRPRRGVAMAGTRRIIMARAFRRAVGLEHIRPWGQKSGAAG
jgi:hypothetical protein